MIMCERCSATLTGKQKRWCSLYCSKLGLKSEWRKRNRDRLREYKRNYDKPKNGGNAPPTASRKLRDSTCLYCGKTEDLQLAHIKPLWAGGKHKWVITLCRKHHHEFDNLLRYWWRDSLKYQENIITDPLSAPNIAKRIIADMEVIQ